jgi:hypothetical protein
MATWKQNVLGAVRNHFAGGTLRLPEGAHQVWEFFVALHETRGSTGLGPAPITYTEIEAFARLMDWPLQPQHVSMIRAIDREWIEFAYRQQGAATRPAANAPRQVLTPALFDAVFG